MYLWGMDLQEALRVTVPFGRHKGKALCDIVEDDPAYMGWLWDAARGQLSGRDFQIKAKKVKEAILVVAPEYEDEIVAADEKKREQKEN